MTAAPPVTVRSPVEGDAELVTRLQKVSFPWAVEPNAAETTRGLFRAMTAATRGPRAAFAIAERGGKFAGYASAQPFAPWVGGEDVLSPDTPVAVVPQVAVVPNARRSGIGRALLDGIHEQLTTQKFSIAIAHTRPDLRSWYVRMGWTVLPENYGLAWIEPPSVLNARLLPAGPPPSAIATHTPLLHQSPMKAHGYTALAFRFTDAPMRAIAAGFYETSDDAVENGRRASAALIAAIDGTPALGKLPRHSAIMLHLSSLPPDEAAAWAEEHLTS